MTLTNWLWMVAGMTFWSVWLRLFSLTWMDWSTIAVTCGGMVVVGVAAKILFEVFDRYEGKDDET